MGDLFKDLVFDNLVKLALNKLFLAVPILGWGPIGILVSFIVDKYVGLLYDEIKLFIDLQAIALKNEKLRKEYDRESVKLKIIYQNFGSDSEEYKKVKDASKKSLDRLISFDFAA